MQYVVVVVVVLVKFQKERPCYSAPVWYCFGFLQFDSPGRCTCTVDKRPRTGASSSWPVSSVRRWWAVRCMQAAARMVGGFENERTRVVD